MKTVFKNGATSFGKAFVNLNLRYELQNNSKEVVDSDWGRSRVLGVTAVPTFVVDHQVLIGFQPYEVLEQFLKTRGAERLNS